MKFIFFSGTQIERGEWIKVDVVCPVGGLVKYEG